MTDDTSQRDEAKALFANLVIMLSTSALQQMGKLVNPMTGKAEVSLQGAQMSIDMLSMLKAKTEGNLDADEGGMLDDVLANLQMNFVETAQSAPAADKATSEKEATDTAQPVADGTSEKEGNPPAGEAKEPKFRKSYGE